MNLSIIIPALNEQEAIKTCLKSIQRQTVAPFETIVVDNGSTDRTAEIAKSLGAKVVLEKKRGLSNARNRGAKASKGDVFCFIDADGRLNKQWVEQAQKSLLNGADIVKGFNYFLHDNGLKFSVYNSYTFTVYLAAMLARTVNKKYYIAGNNCAIRKEIFEKLGGFENVVAEDIWLSRKLWKMKNIKCVDNYNMRIAYSSRGFDSAGFLKTLLYWSKATKRKKSLKNYSYKNKT